LLKFFNAHNCSLYGNSLLMLSLRFWTISIKYNLDWPCFETFLFHDFHLQSDVRICAMMIYQSSSLLCRRAGKIEKTGEKRVHRYHLNGTYIWSDQGWFIKVLLWAIYLQKEFTEHVVMLSNEPQRVFFCRPIFYGEYFHLSGKLCWFQEIMAQDTYLEIIKLKLVVYSKI